MNIYNKINELKNEIIRKMMLLKSDKRFDELVDILKQREIVLEQSFFNIEDKTNLDWQEYYANLCLFLEKDVMRIVNIYRKHSDTSLSIYDDSSNEINTKLNKKIVEITKCIQNNKDTYCDQLLVDYITNKYSLIRKKYENIIEDIIANNKTNLINDLTNSYQIVPILTLYPNLTMAKQSYLSDLSNVLDDFISYINSLIANKKIIFDKETLIESIITKINDSKLKTEFTKIKNNYYQSITHINSIDTKLCVFQKQYFDELDNFYERVCQIEQNFDNQQILNNYFNYLTNHNLYKIKFDKLFEIKNYLANHDNLELDNLLIKTYYEVIKLELYYNNGESRLYYQLDERMKLSLERLFLSELATYLDEFLDKHVFKQFVNEPFSLKLLTRFVNHTINELQSDILNKYQTDFEVKNKENNQLENLDYVCYNDPFFDDLGEALILLRTEEDNIINYHRSNNQYQKRLINNNLYVANRNGQVRKVELYNGNLSTSELISNIKYHDGVIIYKYVYYNDDVSVVIADTKETIGDHICAIIPVNKFSLKYPVNPKSYDNYREGLIRVIDKSLDKYSAFIDKYGKLVFYTKKYKNCDFVQSFSNGYALLSYSANNQSIYEFIDKKGKSQKKFAFSRYQNYIVLPFNNGVGVVVDCNIPENSTFFDTNFQPIYEDYEYQELDRYELDDATIIKYCLKSKKDGLTYIPGKEGLVQMHHDNIIDYYSTENYQLVKNAQGELSFINKKLPQVNSIVDILYKQYLISNQPQNNKPKLIEHRLRTL